MIPALEIPADIDLRLFSSFLSQVGINHRITDAGVNQVVWVDDEEVRDRVIRYYSQMSSGEVVLEDESGTRTGRLSLASRLVSNIWRFPLTMLLILVNLLLFPLSLNIVQADLLGFFSQLTFLQFHFDGNSLLFSTLTESMQAHEYWRLLTPMFIHFSWMHIVFNLLWVWEIGRRIESQNGTSVLLLVTLVSSLIANLLQYAMSGPGLFGGMSGVVFGYLGHCLVWDKLVPRHLMGVRDGVYVFMLVFLVVGFSGAIDLLGMGTLANGAHLGGLLGGVLTGAVAGLLQRYGSTQR
jgi:GlpG protein